MDTEKKTYFEEMKDLATAYVEDRLLLVKLEAAEKAAVATAALVKGVIVAVLLFFIAAILTFLMGYYLSVVTGKIWAGFGIVLVVYVLLLLFFLNYHKKHLGKYITDKVIEAIFKNNH